MFQWLVRWRETRRLRRRGLFEYFDGRRWRFGDPYALFRRITCDSQINLEAIAGPAEQGREPETTQLADLVCRVFEVRRFDPATGDGLTDSELFVLLDRFYDWLMALKKNGSRGPILSPRMASTSSESPEPQDSITKP